MTFSSGLMVGFVIGSLWVVALAVCFFWYNLSKAKQERWSLQTQDYRPHREGNIVAFRRR